MPSIEKSIFIHIGLHKTGTTFLNSEVYPRLRDVTHLGKPYDLDDPLRLMIEDVMLSAYGEFDVDAARAVLAGIYGKLPASAHKISISEGRLSLPNHADRTIIAERLREVFGAATIILTLRRQPEFLESLYYQAIGARNARLGYADWVQQFADHGGKRSFNLLNYHALVEAYARAFGAENVKVLLYEQLREDREGFARTLAEIFGVDSELLLGHIDKPARNTRMTRGHATLLRQPTLARIANAARSTLPKPVLDIARGVLDLTGRAATVLPADLENAVLADPRVSNRELARKYDLPLAKFGYPM